MLSLLFTICMIWIFGKLFILGVKATWSFSKFILTLIILPAVLIVMVIGGLLSVAFPILIVIGIISFLGNVKNNL
nr:hypothetical protein [uncultured Sellimonas sp.]